MEICLRICSLCGSQCCQIYADLILVKAIRKIFLLVFLSMIAQITLNGCSNDQGFEHQKVFQLMGSASWWHCVKMGSTSTDCLKAVEYSVAPKPPELFLCLLELCGLIISYLCFAEYDSDTSCHYKMELSYENFITSGPDPHPPPIADDESDDDDDDDIPRVSKFLPITT